MKIATILGARPQFIKAAVVSRAIAGHNAAAPRQARLSEVVIHTGQHHDANMSRVFFEQMRLPEPALFLGIHGLSHGAMTGQMLERIEAALVAESPDLVLVYGDTNTTLAGALAAAKLNIPVAHVEAGLRSFNRRMPEEINRVLADHVSTLLFCPTAGAVENLGREGIGRGLNAGQRVLLVGDVMYDAALFYAKEAEARSDITARLGLAGRDFVLCTVHRAENTDDPARLADLLKGLARIAQEMPVVLPLHPRTRKCAGEAGLDPAAAGLTVLEPQSYFDMLALLRACRLVATDSGGLQKEAFFFAKPCVTLRQETEWTELVALGANRLAVGSESVHAAFRAMLEVAVPPGVKPYGDGDAGGKIVRVLAGG